MKPTHLTVWVTALVVIVSFLSPIFASETGSAATTRLSEAQALQIARVFCRKVSLPITIPGTTKFVPNPDINPGSYWQSRWQVEFPGQARVEVADASGIITEFSNERYSIVHMDDTDPPGEPISQEEAVQRSKQALVATGQVEPIKFGYAQILQSTHPAYAKASIWYVYWDRTRDGVTYHDQHASVGMDAQTGEIRGFALVFPTPPLASARKVLTQENAVGQAASIIVNQGIEKSASQTDTHLEIVQVGSDMKTVRLAWISTFVVDGHWRQVYLDAETGDVVGGGRDNGPAGHGGPEKVKVPAALPLPQMLKAPGKVYLRRDSSPTGGTTKPLFQFSASREPHAIALLTKTADFQVGPTPEIASDEMVIISKSGAIGVYAYHPETGVLGGGAETATVPAELKVWMQRKLDAVSAKDKEKVLK